MFTRFFAFAKETVLFFFRFLCVKAYSSVKEFPHLLTIHFDIATPESAIIKQATYAIAMPKMKYNVGEKFTIKVEIHTATITPTMQTGNIQIM